MSSYKQLKEQFVTGFSGSSKEDIAFITSFLPVRPPQLSILFSTLYFQKSHFFINFILLVLPVVLSVCWTDYSIHKLLILALLILFKRNSLINPLKNKRSATYLESNDSRYYFISIYRSLLLLATCVSILAVDFPVYPRKFVKTEYKGVSLMDIGTGSVLFSSALVARHTRTKESLSKRIPQAVLSGLPLWVIGIGKFLVHASVDYQEHVSEYGVHWNFFMSLGFVSLLSAVLDLDGFSSLGFSVLVMVLYQGCLFYGLEEFILSAPRDGFFSMNREGICGCVGFFCIYQIGVGLKRFVLVPGKEGKRLAGFTGFFVFISYLIGGESRRLVISIQTNLGYVFWVVGHNLFSLLSLWLVERSSLLPITNEVLDSINFNQLPYFMISNLATGIVNLSMQTIFASDLTGFLVVVLYQLIVLSILWTLKVFKIRLNMLAIEGPRFDISNGILVNARKVHFCTDQSVSGTGGSFWDAAVILMGYFLKNELDKGKNIVELGCGIGVLSVSLKVAGFRNVLATDLPEVIQVTAKNASMNEVDLEVQQLDWYQPRFIDCEVVLLADCVWINELLLPLVRTLKLLLKPGNRAFACNKMRSRVVYQRFLDLLEENFLAIENVHQDEDYFISVITAK